jgi:uncharacterized protein YjbI with pentapeptide repeats
LKNYNFVGSNLQGANFEGANLQGANFQGANLQGANFTNATLTDANLIDANLQGANLQGANFQGANLQGANFTNATLTDANLIDANLIDVDFRYANLINANLTNANLTDASLVQATLIGAMLRNANLAGVDLRNANLTDATLVVANLTEAILINANLTDANLREANLTNADLENANLNYTYLFEANLTNANFVDANVTNAIFVSNYADASEDLIKRMIVLLSRSQLQTLNLKTIENVFDAENVFDPVNGVMPIREVDDDHVIFYIDKHKEGFSYPRYALQNGYDDKSLIFVSCRKQSLSAVNIRNVKPDILYFRLNLTMTILVPINAMKYLLRSKHKEWYLSESKVSEEFIASIQVVYGNHGENIFGENFNIVSKDHCQLGTRQKIYYLCPVRLIRSRGGNISKRVKKMKGRNSKKRKRFN